MDKKIRIAILNNEFEAQLLEAALNEQQIDHHLECYHDLAYDGIFQLQRGWGTVYASNADRLTVIKIIEDIRKIPQENDEIDN